MASQSPLRRIKDFLFFPLRAVAAFDDDRWGLSSLRSERYAYCASAVRGYCLDVGCGPRNRFVAEYLAGNGRGIDVFPYEGLGPQNIVKDPSRLPFEQGGFETVTFIANLNHIPRHLRDAEIAEAFRCLKRGGNILVTMGSPLAEILAHLAVAVYDRLFGTKHDIDHLRGMQEGEDYFVTGREIRLRLERAGFVRVSRRRFWTQWGLNGMYIGWKPT